jgi:hypothetical protein
VREAFTVESLARWAVISFLIAQAVAWLLEIRAIGFREWMQASLRQSYFRLFPIFSLTLSLRVDSVGHIGIDSICWMYCRFASDMSHAPNQSVERTGMSRSAQCQLRRQRRLIPVAHLWRSA